MSEHERELGNPVIGLCNRCGLTVASEEDFSKHLMDAHKGQEASRLPVPELNAQQGNAEIGNCHICAMTLPTQEGLSEHLMKAHGSKEAVSGSS